MSRTTQGIPYLRQDLEHPLVLARDILEDALNDGLTFREIRREHEDSPEFCRLLHRAAELFIEANRSKPRTRWGGIAARLADELRLDE